MKHGTYVGRDANLKGKTALIRPDSQEYLHRSFSPFIEVQFDEFGLIHNGVDLSHGWHTFESKEFLDDQDDD